MAKLARIHSITYLADDRVQISYTAGEPPLSESPTGTLVYDSKQIFHDAVAAFEQDISDEQLLFLAAATWLKSDQNMQNPAAAAGRTAQLDLLGAAQTIKLT